MLTYLYMLSALKTNRNPLINHFYKWQCLLRQMVSFFLFFSFSEVFIYRLCPTSYISQSIFGKNQSRSIFILTCFRSWNSLYFFKISKIIQWKVRRNIIIYISIIFITTVSNSQTPSVKLPTSKEMALSFFRLSKNVLAYFQ